MIKSKKRVRDLGEVFTAEREVNSMLDLVMDESYRIDSRFLEPACGTGNFLIKIIERKLETISKYSINHENKEFNSLVAAASIYGVDICPENVLHSQKRVKSFILSNNEGASRYFKEALNYIIKHNIVLGDMLNGRDNIRFIEYKTPKITSDFSTTLANGIKQKYIDSSFYRFRLIEYNVNNLDLPLRKSRLVSARGISQALK